jgi:hypothetical protein
MVKTVGDPPSGETQQYQRQQGARNPMHPATMFPTSVYLRCPVTHDNSPDRDTFPNKNGMHKGIGRGGGTPCLVHLSDQTAKFKAFNVNEMNAISVIVAECEFVCIQKIVDFPLGVSCFGTCKASKRM